MKSFLDRLRRKSAATRAKQIETPSPAPENPEAEKVTAPDSALTATVSDKAATDSAPESPTGPTIELQIGDFLERIPPGLLKPGQIDRTLKLRFDLNAIADQFRRSDPRIPLIEIYKRQPDIFCRERVESSDATILLPWQKVVDMVLARDRSTDSVPPALLKALTASLREQRNGGKKGASDSPNGEPQNGARPGQDASSRSWFSAKPMPSGALTTLPSTLRPPPTAGEALNLSRSARKPAPAKPVESRPFASILDGESNVHDFEQAPVTKVAPTPRRPASEVLGDQLASINTHFERLVRQLEETTQTQAPARAQQIPGLEHLIRIAEQKVADANREHEAVVSLKSHLDSQYEALTFAQSGVATLQETLTAQSTEFGRMQQVLESVEGQLAAMTSERDAVAAEKSQLEQEISKLRADQQPAPDDSNGDRELRNRISELEAQLEHQRHNAPALARRSAARAVAHRVGGFPTTGRGPKGRLIQWPAYLTALTRNSLPEKSRG